MEKSDRSLNTQWKSWMNLRVYLLFFFLGLLVNFHQGFLRLGNDFSVNTILPVCLLLGQFMRVCPAKISFLINFNSRVIYIKWFQCFKPLLCLFFLFQDYTAAFQLKFIGDSVCLSEFFVKVKNRLRRKSRHFAIFIYLKCFQVLKVSTINIKVLVA